MPKKLFCAFLSAVMTLAAALGGCGESTADSTPDTADTAVAAAATADDVTAPSVSGSTDDTATDDEAAEIQWNYSELKRQSTAVSQSFDDIADAAGFKGTVYVKVGTALEYICTDGFANEDTHTSNSSSTRYRVASLTKQFTAAAVMKLKEAGKVNLDDTIDKYFPNYKYGEKITVKNLLNMTAGLKDYLDIGKDAEPEFDVSEDSSAEENKQAIMNWILKQELSYEPGEKYTYSNSAYFLLGDIIEQASGMEYEEYVTNNLLRPAGMTDSDFTADDEVATGYQTSNDGEWVLYDGVCYSAAGLVSNVPDLLKWVEALTSGEIISEESFKEMTTPCKGGYGCGLYVSDNGLISHAGKIDRYNSELVFTANGNYIFVALSNYADSNPAALFDGFESVLSEYRY